MCSQLVFYFNGTTLLLSLSVCGCHMSFTFLLFIHFKLLEDLILLCCSSHQLSHSGAAWLPEVEEIKNLSWFLVPFSLPVPTMQLFLKQLQHGVKCCSLITWLSPCRQSLSPSTGFVFCAGTVTPNLPTSLWLQKSAHSFITSSSVWNVPMMQLLRTLGNKNISLSC